MRLIASTLALKGVLALAAGGDMSLRHLARAVEATPSSAHRALSVLLDDGIARRHRDRPAFGLDEGQLANHVVALALIVLPLETAAAIVGRANPAIEFAAKDGATLVVVFSSRPPASVVSRGAAILERLADHHELHLRGMDHRDARDELLARPELRDEMRRTRILHGELDRSFPDRSRHGMTVGRRLGRAHPSLQRPSRRFLSRLARRHGIQSLLLFGSAVRSDFRPDSDVDVLVRFRPGTHPTLGPLADLENELGEALDRDVDVVRAESLGPELRGRVMAESVPLL